MSSSSTGSSFPILDFCLPVEPVALQRPRVTSRGTYTPEKSRNALALIKTLLKLKCRKPVQGPLAVTLEFFRKRPKSTKDEFPTARPDLDNYIKLVLDAGNGVVWEDDSQIVDLQASKRYGSESKIHITVCEVTHGVETRR